MTTINIYLLNKMYQPELGPEKENIFHIFTAETLLVEILTYRQSKVTSYKNLSFFFVPILSKIGFLSYFPCFVTMSATSITTPEISLLKFRGKTILISNIKCLHSERSETNLQNVYILIFYD